MAQKIFFTLQNISAVLMMGLCFGIIWGTQKAIGTSGSSPAPVAASNVAPEREPSDAPTVPDAPTAPTLDLIADDELGATLQVRATYLLQVGRDSGSAGNPDRKRIVREQLACFQLFRN